MFERWTDPAFLTGAHAWIRDHVDVRGEPEQPHVKPWSTVLRIPTPHGDVFFKASAVGFDHEARVLDVLIPLAPDLLPEVVALDAERGWMLVADAGERLREHPSDGVWRDVLPRYADLQLAAAGQVQRLVDGGVPDRRLANLPALYEHLGGRETGVVEDLCGELAGLALFETIQHDDLHDGQVFIRNGRRRILDWGDSCVSHPFMTFGVTHGFLDPAALDGYLARWTTVAPIERLHAAVPIAMRLAGISRADTWSRVFPVAPLEWQERYADAIEVWLRRVSTPPDHWDK